MLGFCIFIIIINSFNLLLTTISFTRVLSESKENGNKSTILAYLMVLIPCVLGIILSFIVMSGI